MTQKKNPQTKKRDNKLLSQQKTTPRSGAGINNLK